MDDRSRSDVDDRSRSDVEAGADPTSARPPGGASSRVDVDGLWADVEVSLVDVGGAKSSGDGRLGSLCRSRSCNQQRNQIHLS